MKSSKKPAHFAGLLIGITVLVILVSFLSACKGGDKKTISTGPAKVVIAMQGDNTPAGKNIVLDALGAATNTEIEIIYIPRSDYQTKLSTIIRRLHTEGLVEPDWATIPNMELFGKLWTGVAGSIEWECVGPTNNWMLGRYTEPVKPTFDFPIIRGPDGSHGVTPRFINLLNGYVISSKADIAACMRIADYVKTEEGQNLLYFGVEDVMYRWIDKDNGIYEYLGQYADAATFRTNGGWVYWENFLTPAANNAGLRALNKQSREGQIQAWAEGLSNVANVIAVLQSRVEYGAEMDQILNEMFANLIVTKDDMKRVYDGYIREWENAGGRLWEKEVNEAWIAQGRRNN